MMRTKQCLHRFCSDCINTALRSGKKECPTCRKKLVSKRCLLPEPRFDLLISQIWPQEKVTPIFKRRMSSRLVQRRECSSNQPSVHSKLSAVPSKSSSSEPKRAVTVLNSESSEKFELDSQLDCPDSDGDVDFEVEGEEGTIDLSIEDEFQVIFKPHPTKMALDNPLIEDNSIRYIKTTANATVNHLHKYLKMRLSLELGSELLKAHRMLKLCIYIARQPSKFVCLRGNQRLRQINDQFWKLNKPMEIFYSTG